MSNFYAGDVTLDWALSATDVFPDADALTSAVHRAITGDAPEGLAEAVAMMAAPAVDVLVTPVSARAAVLGMQRGLDFTHHELRRRIAMPPGLEPEVDVWEHGSIPVWSEGVLTEPKYFSFFQDAPLPVHNPNYRRKWRAHELLHGAVGFFWHPEQSRFEAYVGARLNEVLPVVHWYGTDEIFRPRSAEHRGKILHREFSARCEALAAPYWAPKPGTELPAKPGSWLWARAEHFAAHAKEHLASELAACREEIATGRVASAPRPKLDSSSDAIGYLAGHWPRITAWSFGQWMELFSRPGVDYTDRIADYADLIESTALRLVTGPLSLDMHQWRRLRTRRVVRDLGYRTLLALEWLPEGGGAAARAEAALWPPLEAMAAQADQLLTDDVADPGVDALMEAFSEVAHLFPEDVTVPWEALGHRVSLDESSWPASSVSYVAEGLLGSAPATCEAMSDEEVSALAASLVSDDVFGSTGLLVERLAAHTHDEVTALEAWVAAQPRKDEHAEWFGALPYELEELAGAPGRLTVNDTLREGTWSASAITAVFGEGLADDLGGGDAIGIAGFVWRGEFRLFAVGEEERLVLDSVRASSEAPRGWLESADLGVVQTLLELGALCWFPGVLLGGKR